MGFLDSRRTYAGNWAVTAREKLDKDDVKAISRIEVVEKEQDWGTSISMCFFMKAGGKKFVSLSRDSELEVGDSVDPKSVEVLTLERDGEEPIFKVDGEAL